MSDDTNWTEQQARAALRPLGFRLSQRNAGFVILDARHHYVVTGHELGGDPEISLQHVAAWLEAEADRETDALGQRPPD